MALSASALGFSRIALGTWQFGSKGTDDYWGLEYTQELATGIVSSAAKSGVTYFDTAEDYAKGESEKQLGVALAALSSEEREKCMVGSKILPNHCSQADVRNYVMESLERLKVNCIDLMMIHWPITKSGMAHFAGNHTTASGGRDYSTSDASLVTNVPSTEIALKELAALQAEGKIKHIGASNFGKKQLEEALATGVKIAVNQLCHSLIFRAIEIEILPFCREHGIEVITYSPLMQGLCLGNWKSASEVPVYRARTRHFNSANEGSKARHGEAGHEALLFETIENIRKVSESCGHSMLELALSYPLHKEGITCVIGGATKPHHIEGNVNAGRIILSPDVLQALDNATEALKQAMGPNCDLWQGSGDSRIS